MREAKRLLKFQFPSQFFQIPNGELIPNHINLLITSRINSLTKIGESDKMDDLPPQDRIKNIYIKFIGLIENQSKIKGQFSRRELRVLSYALHYKERNKPSIMEDEYYLNRFLEMLKSNWRFRYIFGLLHCYLSNWMELPNSQYFRLFHFIQEKIKNYNGTRDKYYSLQKNLKFFEIRRGDVDLGATIALSNGKLTEVANVLNIPVGWITYPYFFRVVDTYFEKSKVRLPDVFDDIALFLEGHSNSRTNKIIVSKIICHMENETNVSLQDKVKNIAIELIGDPNVDFYWSFEEGTDKEQKIILKAKNILNKWLTEQFITVFFEKCLNEPRRKQFWIKYSNRISSFKIFGPTSVKEKLKKDDRISDYVDSRYYVTNDKKNEVTAFVIKIGDYYLIDFSDLGYAFYAYKKTNIKAKLIETEVVRTVDQFRDGRMPMLIYRKGYALSPPSPEGRLSRQDGILEWEEVLKVWLKEFVL